MSTSPANMHDWEFERESARDAEIQDAIAEHIRDLEISSGHGDAEQKLIERVIDQLFQSDIATEMFRRYLFEIWRRRNAQDEEGKKKMARAAQIIANLLSPILRDIVSSDIHKEFGE
jgi:signal recognition particle GTPase